MIAFLLRRLAVGVLVLVALSIVSFCFFTWEQQHQGLQPLLSAWWAWAKGLDGGDTMHTLTFPVRTRNFTVGVRMIDAVGHTAVLLALMVAIVVLLSVGLALLAVARQGSGLDIGLRALSYAAWAVPAFLLALLVQLLLNTVVGPRWVFPLAGWPGTCPAGIGINAGTITPCAAAGHGGRYVLNVLRYATLPALTLSLGFVGLHARYLRSSLLETMSAPFVTTARSKGLSERRVLLRHALPASLATFVGALFSDFGAVLGAGFAVDYVFQFNGLGTVFISSFPQGFGGIDPNQMTFVLMLAAVLVIVSSLAGDVAVQLLDPRARTGR
ncbi:MAG TPA: ABC transporter permease [Gaiellaceae bacterium]|nr:ABC transporter permease [Gaiellaceae bacterium]